MNNLKIIQSESNTEYNVPGSAVTKLSEIALSNIDNIELSGSISVKSTDAVYLDDVNYLTDQFPNLHIIASKQYIKFADQNVLSVLLNNGYSSDGVGITTIDASTLKNSITASLFLNNENIDTFNELQYFTSVTTIGRYAFLKSSIHDIDLRNIQEIGERAFEGCSNLGVITLPNVSNFGALSFANSTIQRVEITSNITLIGSTTQAANNVFAGCNIGYLKIPSTVTTLGYGAFGGVILQLDYDETNLEYGNGFGSYVKDVWNYKNLVNTNTYGSMFVTSTDNNTTTVLNQIYLPKLDKTISADTFNYGKIFYAAFTGKRRDFLLCSLIYFRDITSFGAGTFNGVTIDTLVINNTTPPGLTATTDNSVINGVADINTNVFSCATSISKIYVPDTAVSTYQNDSKYSSMAAKIYPISQCPKYATEELWRAANKPIALIEECM